MGEARVERFSKDVCSEDLISALERDGCAIVEGAMLAEQCARLSGELDDFIAAKAPGVRKWDAEANPLPDGSDRPTLDGDFDSLEDMSPANLVALIQDFYGFDTVRIDGLPGKSATFVELMCHPLLLAAADHILLPNCKHYTLNTGQLIEIRPGETSQTLHRDEVAWGYYRESRPQLTVEAMFALSDFSDENGATRVVPGSHRWDEAREPEADEIAIAEMPAGSAVVYLGSTLHGGGANRTERERRRGMFLGYCLGWLRTEENTYLTIPIEAVRGMPRRAQELLGYDSHLGIGVVDVGSPMKLLRDPA